MDPEKAQFESRDRPASVRNFSRPSVHSETRDATRSRRASYQSISTPSLPQESRPQTRDIDLEKAMSSSASDDTIIPHNKETHEPLPTVEKTTDISRIKSRQSQRSTTSGGALSRVFSRPPDFVPGPAPDGGFKAWFQVFLAHMVIFCTWGYVLAFGVFQEYLTESLGRSDSDIAWIGSIQVCLLFFLGTLSGRLADSGYFRHVFFVGIIFQLLGPFMASLSTTYWQLLLAQGICSGIGNGLVFCPVVALVATYFTKKRALALAIAASGSASGGLVFPAMASQLLGKVGAPWTFRAIGFLMLGVEVVNFTFLRQRLPPRRAGPWIEISAFKEAPYVLFAFGCFFMFWGIYPAFYYVGTFAVSQLGFSNQASIYLILVMNGVGFIGRILPGIISDAYTGPLNLMVFAVLASGVLLYGWIGITAAASMWVWSVLYGLSAAMNQSLFPAVLSSLTSDPQKQGVRIGMVFTIISIATLTGTPIAGALIQNDGGKYLDAQVFSATVIFGSAVLLAACRYTRVGTKFVKI